VDAELKWKVRWNGREWWTRSEIDAAVLLGMLKESWPGKADPEVWELVAMGGWDPITQVNFDGWGWQQVVWRSGRFERVEPPETQNDSEGGPSH
jgi:hypothetical protein